MTTPCFAAQEDSLLLRLNGIAGRMPELARTARLYEALLPLLRDDPAVLSPASLAPERAAEKLRQGRSLLQDLDMELDISELSGLLIRLATAAETAGENVSSSKLQTWLQERHDDMAAFFQDVLNGGGKLFADAAELLGMDGELCRALMQNALKPALRAWGRQLSPLATGVSWNRGTCYVCGALPILGELQGNAQTLHLRCGLCGADWEYSRLACVHCGHDDHRKRDYLFFEGEHEKAHIEACKSCGNYLKVIPAYAPTPAEMLAVEDLATVHLDVIAGERGYRRAGTDT